MAQTLEDLDSRPFCLETDAAIVPFPSERAFLKPFNVVLKRAQDLGGVVLGAASDIARGVSGVVEGVAQYGSEVINGEYSPEFKRDMHNRHPFVASDGVPLTFRILNEQFIENSPVYAYNDSLLVPAKHGAEIPTVADIADYARTHERAVILTTTDGFSNKLDADQLRSLTDFHNITRRRWELYNSVLKNNQELIIAGASLGGMLAYDLAATQGQYSDLFVRKIIAICSAGHNEYPIPSLPLYAKQFLVGEGWGAKEYVMGGENPKQVAQRAFELLGTLPRHKQHYAAAFMTTIGILRSPLLGVEAKIPHTTEVIDEVYGHDYVTHPHLRENNWNLTDHPENMHTLFYMPGLRHLALLTQGRQTTRQHLSENPSIGSAVLRAA